MTSKTTAETPGVFAQTFSVPEDAIDELGHVSNLKYLAWMQNIAIQHSAARGWPVERYLENGAVWVVRSHFITYLRPAFAGETITLRTWVAEFRQRSSSRRYLVSREERVLAEAVTINQKAGNMTAELISRYSQGHLSVMQGRLRQAGISMARS